MKITRRAPSVNATVSWTASAVDAIRSSTAGCSAISARIDDPGPPRCRRSKEGTLTRSPERSSSRSEPDTSSGRPSDTGRSSGKMRTELTWPANTTGSDASIAPFSVRARRIGSRWVIATVSCVHMSSTTNALFPSIDEWNAISTARARHAPLSISWRTRCAITSVSVSETQVATPASSRRSESAFSMIPLWTTASRPS